MRINNVFTAQGRGRFHPSLSLARLPVSSSTLVLPGKTHIFQLLSSERDLRAPVYARLRRGVYVCVAERNLEAQLSETNR